MILIDYIKFSTHTHTHTQKSVTIPTSPVLSFASCWISSTSSFTWSLVSPWGSSSFNWGGLREREGKRRGKGRGREGERERGREGRKGRRGVINRYVIDAQVMKLRLKVSRWWRRQTCQGSRWGILRSVGWRVVSGSKHFLPCSSVARESAGSLGDAWSVRVWVSECVHTLVFSHLSTKSA